MFCGNEYSDKTAPASPKPNDHVEQEGRDDVIVVLDHASGLMWQQESSGKIITYDQALTYIARLNEEKSCR